MTNLFSSLKTLGHVVLDDLFNEEPSVTDNRLTDVMSEANQQLAGLREALNEAIGRTKRRELEWQASLEKMNVLNSAIDEAVRDGHVGQAEAWLKKVRQMQVQVNELSTQYQIELATARQMAIAIDEVQLRFEELQRRSDHITDRAQSVALLEQIAQLQRSMRRETSTLHADLIELEDDVTRREDRVAARQEIVS